MTFREELKKVKPFIHGSLLAIDPASGASSYPGYAFFVDGVLKESGFIRLTKGSLIQVRLQELYDTLSKTWTQVDVLAIEMIAPFFGGMGAHAYRNKSTVVLHYSVGVAMTAINSKIMIEVPVISWQSWCKKHWPEYEKSDENDAIAIGKCLIWEAKYAAEGDTPILPRPTKRRATKATSRTRK